MRLIVCHVENFGKLHDLTVEFRRECHVLCEENGWGKSTLAAFLRVMFFGFEGETKRKGIENERKRYQPWQGGVYGGSVTFETGDRIYMVSRSFSDKKVNDSFELRNVRTNLISTDFSENLGEELFHINSESFMRTAFIGQNDCSTQATDSINAKIGNFTDTMNDLDSYEKASAALQDVLNKLNPRRKTGIIRQMNDRITGMQTEISQNQSLRSSLRQYEKLVSEEKVKLLEKKQEQAKVLALQEQVSRMQDKSVRRAAYRQICEACEEAETACQAVENWFPGEIPTEETLRECQKACDEMERAAHGVQLCRLSQQENEQLEELEAQRAKERLMHSRSERYDSGEPCICPEDETVHDSSERLNYGEYVSSPSEQQEEQKKERIRLHRLLGTLVVAAGAVCCLCSLALRFLFADGFVSSASRSVILFPGMLILGFLFVVAGMILMITGTVRQRRDQERDAQERERKEKERIQEEEAQKRVREESARNRERLYETLLKKQRDYQSYREQYVQRRDFIAGEFAKMGMSIGIYGETDEYSESGQPVIRKAMDKDVQSVKNAEVYTNSGYSVREQFQEIQQQRMEWQRSKTAAEAAHLKKREFESQYGGDLFPADETTQKLPDLESLNQRQRQLEADTDQIRSRLEIFNHQLSSLREQYDEWTQTKETLQSAQEQVADLRNQYRQVKKAQEYLAVAKETLTARYMEPLMRSFSRYYQILAGASGTPVEKYHMDANINLTVEEAGMQRETQYLSRGYQDLIGLCLRLSLVDAMYPDEKPFLILDDPFVNLDKEKRAGGIRLLREVSESCQIIYVTSTAFVKGSDVRIPVLKS
ncbi:MAG: hypothetical protein LUG54_10500 [Clostridiales bacterium]|nr:hypothetical protein [Clostridiales bacterium]